MVGLAVQIKKLAASSPLVFAPEGAIEPADVTERIAADVQKLPYGVFADGVRVMEDIG